MKMGILIINKPKEYTSHDVVSILRKKLNYKKIGHTGTLDPLATGVLPICIGNATRVSEYIMNQGKAYIAEFKFGFSTDTYDITGKKLQTSENTEFSFEDIDNALKNFVGEIEQTPPIYSAIKVNGKKLYEYARENKKIEIKSRIVNIYKLELIEYKDEVVKIKIHCSKGTYIRSLIHDIGIYLDTFATMISLIRTDVGKFNLDNSITIDEIKEMDIEEIQNKFYSIEDSLYNLPKIDIRENIFDRLKNGQKINIKSLESIKTISINENNDILVFVNNIFLGIGKIKNEILKMEKVLWQE